MYRVLLSGWDCLSCFALNRLANSCSPLNSYTTALSQALQSDHDVVSPSCVHLLHLLHPVQCVPGAGALQMCGRTRQSLQQCQPSGKGCSVQNVLPLPSHRWGVSAQGKEGALRFPYHQGFKMTHAGPASSLRGAKQTVISQDPCWPKKRQEQ